MIKKDRFFWEEVSKNFEAYEEAMRNTLITKNELINMSRPVVKGFVRPLNEKEVKQKAERKIHEEWKYFTEAPMVKPIKDIKIPYAIPLKSSINNKGNFFQRKAKEWHWKPSTNQIRIDPRGNLGKNKTLHVVMAIIVPWLALFLVWILEHYFPTIK